MKKIGRFFKEIPIPYLVIFIADLCIVITFIICEVVDVKVIDEKTFLKEGILIFFSLLQTLIVLIFLNKEFQKNRVLQRNNNGIKKQGIEIVNVKGGMTPRETREMYKNAMVIKMCLVGGYRYYKSVEPLIREAIKSREVHIRILLANEKSPFVHDIMEELEAINSKEENIGNNTGFNNVAKEIIEVKRLITELSKEDNKGTIELKQYESEYRTPFYLSYEKCDNDTLIKGWYNSIGVPVRSPRQTLMFHGSLMESDRQEYLHEAIDTGKADICFTGSKLKSEKRHFVVDLEVHFNYLWNKY